MCVCGSWTGSGWQRALGSPIATAQLSGTAVGRFVPGAPTPFTVARGSQTVLVGPLPDQAALHGVLAWIGALGLELLEVRRLGS